MYVQSYRFLAIKQNIARDIYRVLILDINHVCAHSNKKNRTFRATEPQNVSTFAPLKVFR